jgi:excisionase family DNA binding protein
VPCTDGWNERSGHVEDKTRNNEARDLLSVEQLADYLGVGRTFAYSLLAEPNPAIRSLKIGRRRLVWRVDVELYVQSRLEET